MDAFARVVVGKPIASGELRDRKHDATCIIEFLRQKTYRLSTYPVNPNAPAFEFK